MLQHRITRMLIAALFLVSFVCAQESRHDDHHTMVHDHIVSHIEGIHNHVDAITRRAKTFLLPDDFPENAFPRPMVGLRGRKHRHLEKRMGGMVLRCKFDSIRISRRLS